MELEIYNAFVKAGVSEADAKAVVESINKEIDKRYGLHSVQLATKSYLAEVETRLTKLIADSQRWTITSVFAAVRLFAAITKIWR